MRLIEKAYAIAQQALQENWSEVPGKESNPRITECYAAIDGLGNPEMLDDSKVAWCSCFVNWCIQQAGGRGTRSAAARSWLRWGNIVDPNKVKEGDIVIFQRGNSKWQGHVAFVIEAGPKFIRVVGGNQHDKVCVADYRRSSVLGFRTSKD